MSHYRVAEEIRRTLAFSPYLQPMEEVHEAIGESFLRVTGPDGRTYGVLVRRINEPVDITGEILRVDPTQDPARFDAYGNPR